MKYTKSVLQLAIFNKNNCLHKSDGLRLNATLNRLLVSSANIYIYIYIYNIIFYIYIEEACHNLMTVIKS